MDNSGFDMRQAILDFPGQLVAVLPVVNGEKLPRTDKFILSGMGGSALAGGLWKVYEPRLDLLLHRDYGLPRVPEYFLTGGLLILSSYSGQTEEVLDTLALARARRLSLAVLASGGVLLEEAEKLSLPRVVLPAGLPPRLAVGYGFVGLSRFLGQEKILTELTGAAKKLDPAGLEPEGERLAGILADKLPIIYASTVNLPLAYNWKILLNETGKTAAFYNVLPEMNHNELAAADPHFSYFFLRDPADEPRLQKRFTRLTEMLVAQGLTVEEIALPVGPPLVKIFQTVILAHWTAYYLAKNRGRDPVGVPLIENFKLRLKLND